MSDDNLESLTKKEIETISRILNTRTFDGEEFELCFEEICGYISGIICGPQIMFPPVWISQLVGEKPPSVDEQELEVLFDLLEKLYNIIAASLRNGISPPAELFPAHPELIENNNYKLSAIESWCEGFYDAITLDETWLDFDAFLMIIFPIAALLSGEDSQMWKEICESENKTTTELREHLLPRISESMLIVYNFILQMRFGTEDSNEFMKSMAADMDDLDAFIEDEEQQGDDSEEEKIIH